MSLALLSHLRHHTTEKGLAQQSGEAPHPFAPAEKAGLGQVAVTPLVDPMAEKIPADPGQSQGDPGPGLEVTLPVDSTERR